MLKHTTTKLIVVAIETGSRWSEESAFVHVVANHFGVETPLDQDAFHCMLPVVRGFLGGSFGPRGVGQVVKHHLLLSCLDKIRANFLVV